MHFTKFTTTCILIIMSVSAIVIPQAATASDPQTIVSEWNDNTGGFNHHLFISIANTKPDAQGHNLVQSAFSGINEKLRNLIALNSELDV
ncbi:uncharacterized protein EAF02_002046 [Botrytis sinoallii]|uniref:uncharacterized protein n=1 Tax=Botrytis sinoallii TaxID=1463999 RepID=UPI001900A38D|nr:uncharacterized protein EAF02_002046 [Botrytis sinoallii]KAF7889631.1 hypothetical protein EAF02_002046 [Botrytis sinoallii]